MVPIIKKVDLLLLLKLHGGVTLSIQKIKLKKFKGHFCLLWNITTYLHHFMVSFLLVNLPNLQLIN